MFFCCTELVGFLASDVAKDFEGPEVVRKVWQACRKTTRSMLKRIRLHGAELSPTKRKADERQVNGQ